jgi:hypothetical protein
MILSSLLESFAEPAQRNGAGPPMLMPEPAAGKRLLRDTRFWAAIVGGLITLCAAVNLATFVLTRAIEAFP